MYIPKIVACFCTRTKNLRNTTKNLVSYFKRADIDVHAIIGAESIFSAYDTFVDSVESDIIIFCHDDIQILMDPLELKKLLVKQHFDKKSGFWGPAGTTFLGGDGVWWNHDNWKAGLHSGLVFHGSLDGDKFEQTLYGPYRPVSVLDGLFLTARTKMLRNINLKKPDYFEGNWDFYDIHYCLQAHKYGRINRAVPYLISHESFGNLAGRDSWHKNRIAFLQKNSHILPWITKGEK